MFFSPWRPGAIRRLTAAAVALLAVASCDSPAGPTTGSLRTDVTGLPAGAAADVSIAGPAGFRDSLTASATISGLEPGDYLVTGLTVRGGTDDYQPQPASQTVSVSAGAQSVAAIAYLAVTGTLDLSVTGLPAGVSAWVQLTGPGTDTVLTGDASLTGLPTGQYQLSAQPVDDGSFGYAPTQADQTVALSGGQLNSAVVSYSNTGPLGLNLRVETAYLVQATQRFDDSSRVALTAGRDALLRVFLSANIANSAQPQVMVTLSRDSVPYDSFAIAAPGTSVPLTVDEGALDQSYNAVIPAADIVPGLGFRAAIVPDPQSGETTTGDNEYPLGGVPHLPSIMQLPPVAVRFVPVHQDSTGLTGNVSFANIPTFTSELERWFPTNGVDADLHAVYSTSAPPLSSADANGAWGQVLNELQLLRLNEGSSRYYYGVVKVNYSSGTAGLAYVPSNPNNDQKAAVGWDRNRVGWVAAHELGHTHGRYHAPGCGAQGIDPLFPQSDGSIGAYGYDSLAMTVVSPVGTFDYMSYCTQAWTSDYTWDRLSQWRLAEAASSSARGSQATTVLALWGRITQSGPVLEPALVLQAPPSLPAASGPNLVEVLAPDGSTLLSLSFAGDLVADLPAPERHFVFLVPVDSTLLGRMGRLRLVTAAGTAVRSSPSGGPGAGVLLDASLEVSRSGGGAITVRWDDSAAPLVLVREVDTGEVVALARRGATRLFSRSQDLEFVVSDGVNSRSLRRRLP